MACAVRRERGDIVLYSEPIPRGVYAGAWSKIPFLRSITVLSDTLVLGTRMLMYSANIQIADEMQKDQAAKQDKAIPGSTAASTTSSGESVQQPLPPAAIYGTMAISLLVGLGVFFGLPVIIANSLDPFFRSAFLNNVLEGVIRLLLFLGYLMLIGRIENVRRIFQYHGAEHKTIAAYEAGSELTPEKIQPYNKEHPRCGTGFLLTVVVISIVFFVALGDLPIVLRLASRILLIPLVAAVSYELIRFASQHRNFPLLDWLVARPSLALQSLTTREPEPAMIEVAIAAFRRVQQQEEAATNQA